MWPRAGLLVRVAGWWGGAKAGPRAECINNRLSSSCFKSPGLQPFNHGAALPWPPSRARPPTSHAEERSGGSPGLTARLFHTASPLIDPRNPGGCLSVDSPHTQHPPPHLTCSVLGFPCHPVYDNSYLSTLPAWKMDLTEQCPPLHGDHIVPSVPKA